MHFNEEGFAVWPNGRINRSWTRAHQAAHDVLTGRGLLPDNTPPLFSGSHTAGAHASALFEQLCGVVEKAGVTPALIAQAKEEAQQLAKAYGR